VENIERTSSGSAVEDVQWRLEQLGYDLGTEAGTGVFGAATAHAVRMFRRDHQLADGDVIDAIAWSALVDATFSLGDRMLFLRMPYQHGNDVRTLQAALNVLGFFYQEVDGIFGGETETAIREFQLNLGLPADGIVGDSTIDAIRRLKHVWKDKPLSAYAEETTGFARVAAVLEATPLCVYGTDRFSRRVALRIANLAAATTSDSRVSSAETLSAPPEPGMALVNITCDHGEVRPGVPRVVFSEDSLFLQHMATAVHESHRHSERLTIELPAAIASADVERTPESAKSLEQHLAVRILDALCIAYI
jgi:peptidoglycan hydrolase-like protein with peptidoglycan-binding domain